MPYQIELMCIGFDGYQLLVDASADLNRLQKDFQFEVTYSDNRAEGLNYKREQYLASEVFKFITDHKKRTGGRRPFVIAFVSKPLNGEKFGNLFGSHRAKEGIAAVTIADFSQFVKEAVRYCQYYIVRYCLSFVNPSIRAHSEIERAACYFHQKVYKPEIRLSMDSGHICDTCLKRLESPDAQDDAETLSISEKNALERMRAWVARQVPYALILKGGGVKGLAYTGALTVLEEFYAFDRFVGTSAGAIAAVLLAAGYTPTELNIILQAKNLKDFLDSPWHTKYFNLLFYGGLHKGETFSSWMLSLMQAKLGNKPYYQMSTLKGALVFASRRNQGAIEFDSTGSRKETDAVFATRCSMSIPFLFVPPKVEGVRVFDGGIRANFPLRNYLDLQENRNFIAIYLNEPIKQSTGMITDLMNIALEGEEQKILDDHSRSIIKINTWPIGFKDFGLSNMEKDFLTMSGRSAALRFLLNRNTEGCKEESFVASQEMQTEELRRNVAKAKGLSL
jgi:predicted acylesterase/phospholipase RssA